jgi:hypothetical protein
VSQRIAIHLADPGLNDREIGERGGPLLDRQLADRQDQQLHHDYGEILGIPVTGDRRQRQRTLIAHTGASIESSRTHLPRPNSFSRAHSIP